MIILPDLFTPYIEGRELGIDRNWKDLQNYGNVQQQQLKNFFDLVTFSPKANYEYEKLDEAALNNRGRERYDAYQDWLYQQGGFPSLFGGHPINAPGRGGLQVPRGSNARTRTTSMGPELTDAATDITTTTGMTQTATTSTPAAEAPYCIDTPSGRMCFNTRQQFTGTPLSGQFSGQTAAPAAPGTAQPATQQTPGAASQPTGERPSQANFRAPNIPPQPGEAGKAPNTVYMYSRVPGYAAGGLQLRETPEYTMTQTPSGRMIEDYRTVPQTQPNLLDDNWRQWWQSQQEENPLVPLPDFYNPIA